MTFEEWKDGYGLVLEPNYSKETEADCLAAFNFGKRESAVLIERQAAQIEMMREGFTNIMVNTCEKFPGQRILQIMEICNKSLSSAPDQALEQFAAIADLSGVIMCEKKPVAYMAVYKDQVMGFIPTQESGTIPVYRAIKELP